MFKKVSVTLVLFMRANQQLPT